MRSALPGPVVDLIRDGVGRADLRARGDKAVWSALCSVATSARQRGWTYADFAGLVTETKSLLGRQAALKGGTKERTRPAQEKQLRSAWAAAGTWLAKTAAPAITRHNVEGTARALRDHAADPDAALLDSDRATLAYAAAEALRRGTDRPALPLRAVAEATSLGTKAVRLALARLTAAGLLTLEDPGAPGGPRAKNRRAALYRLGQPPTAALAPTTPNTPPEDTADMATITIDMTTLTEAQRDAILAALAPTTPTTLPENVVPLVRRSA